MENVNISRTSPNYETFFHTRCWMEIITKTFPSLQDASIAVEFPDGRKAVLPLVRQSIGRYGLFYRYSSMWPGVYGGIVSDGHITSEEFAQILQGLRGPRLAGGYVLGNPFSEQEIPGSYQTETLNSRVVDLREGVDAVWRRMESTFRRRVKRAREKGVDVEPASSQADYAEYYEVYKDSLRRWGDKATSHYPFRLFKNIREAEKRYPDAIRLWLARINGHVAAGALIFYHARHAVSWHAATREADYKYSPANALQMAIIEDACARGLSFYDLNPSGGHKGTERFKIGMGAEKHPFTKVILSPGILWKMYMGMRSAGRRMVGLTS